MKHRKTKSSFDLTSDPFTLEHFFLNYLEKPNNVDYSEDHSYFDCSEECQITSFESKSFLESKTSSCDSEINLQFAYQSLECESDIDHKFWY